jgi:hypothetical protein
MTTTPANTTFHGSETLRTELIEQMREHQRLDRLVQGAYLATSKWGPAAIGGNDTTWRGCSLGCLVTGNLLADGTAESAEEVNTTVGFDFVWQEKWAEITGLPLWLAYVNEAIFERLPSDRARDWPLLLLESIPAGVTLDAARDAFCADLQVHIGEDIDRLPEDLVHVIAEDGDVDDFWVSEYADLLITHITQTGV